MSAILEIRGLEAEVDGKPILKGVDLVIEPGETHAIMGPNGSGKSTLSHVITGHPAYTVSGSARLGDDELLGLEVDARSRLGVIQGFQYPTEVPGIRLAEFVRAAAEERGLAPEGVDARIEQAAALFGLEPFLNRSLNDDLSGGEKKKSEIFQMAVLEPKVAILDEIDSGLDIDAVRSVAEAVEAMRSPDVAILMITHYARILRYLSPDRIHVMIDGRIVESGGVELAKELEDGGYEAVRQRLGIESRAQATPTPAASDFFTDLPFEK